MPELAILTVTVVDEKLRLLLKTRVPNLLLHPVQRRVLGHVKVDNLSACKLHDDEDVKNTETEGVLHEEIAGPDDLGLILNEGAPALRVSGASPPMSPVLPDSCCGVPHAEFQFQLQRNSVFTVLGMIR
jgi:hypothetical protein